jgi:phage gp46-like protein
VIDFTIQNDGMLFAQTQDSLYNNIYLSIMVPKGRFFFNPDFGSRLGTIKTITPDNILLAIDYCKEALQWLVSIGRIKNMEIQALRDDNNPSQLNFAIAVTASDNRAVTYSLFYRVI